MSETITPEQNAEPNTRPGMIPWYFVMFFGVIVAVNSVFVYKALETHTGVVTEQAYEKGLAYNETLEQARSQPAWKEQASFDNGVVRWQIADENGRAITDADVTASIYRQVRQGHDHKVTLVHKGNGVYESKVNLPLSGQWIAKLESQWNDKQYRTTLKFMAP